METKTATFQEYASQKLCKITTQWITQSLRPSFNENFNK